MLAKSFRQFAKATQIPKYFFNLHEYQSHQLMKEYGVKVPAGTIAQSGSEAFQVASLLNPQYGLVVKAQVQAGGRGKGQLSSGLQGGVHVVKTPEEIQKLTEQMVGYELTTKQTGNKGLHVGAVLINEGVKIVRENYLAFILDRSKQNSVIVASKRGGMNIEEVAEEDPTAIIVETVNPHTGLSQENIDNLINKLDLGASRQQAGDQIQCLYNMFKGLDATQVEINPFAVDVDGNLVTVDAKLNIDDNATFRQQKLLDLKQSSVASEDTDPLEDKAHDAGLSYVALDGNIGCLVNGAGLAMSTMDIIKINGGDPANFLDCGGAADEQQVTTAFEILTQHPNVNTILINIFGGILSCKMMAQGIIKAAQNVGLKLPLVVRLEGFEAKEGMEALLEYSKSNPSLQVQVGEDLQDVAAIACKTAAR